MSTDANPQTAQGIAAIAAGSAMRRHASKKNIAGPTAVMPGGNVISATNALRNMYRQQKQADTFGDIDVHPEKYLKNHQPGFRYVWVNPKDHGTQGRIRSSRYTEVSTDELLDDCDLPYVPGTSNIAGKTHKTVKSTVDIYDVRLCAVSPKAYYELFTSREDMAIARIASGTDSFYGDIESQGAVASTEVFNSDGEQVSGDEV